MAHRMNNRVDRVIDKSPCIANKAGRPPGRPKGLLQSAETRAKLSELLKLRWQNPEYRAKQAAWRMTGIPMPKPPKPARKLLPPRGTAERRLYDKIASIIGAPAARAAL